MNDYFLPRIRVLVVSSDGRARFVVLYNLSITNRQLNWFGDLDSLVIQFLRRLADIGQELLVLRSDIGLALEVAFHCCNAGQVIHQDRVV